MKNNNYLKITDIKYKWDFSKTNFTVSVQFRIKSNFFKNSFMNY